MQAETECLGRYKGNKCNLLFGEWGSITIETVIPRATSATCFRDSNIKGNKCNLL